MICYLQLYFSSIFKNYIVERSHMDKRYQVFISSTFKDLEVERSTVFQTLMEMDCIPAGMELFPSIDE